MLIQVLFHNYHSISSTSCYKVSQRSQTKVLKELGIRILLQFQHKYIFMLAGNIKEKKVRKGKNIQVAEGSDNTKPKKL